LKKNKVNWKENLFETKAFENGFGDEESVEQITITHLHWTIN